MGGAQPTTLPSTLIVPMQSSLPITPPGRNIPTRGRSPTKKALLIGISYYKARGSWEPIPTSIPNVKQFATFLKEHEGYTDIVVMTDEVGVDELYQPTTDNLNREMRRFTRGAIAGDRLVFYYAGHSDQLLCETGSEEDGMDEALVTVSGKKIRDNTLNNLLVKPLPKGSTLIAIFDSCTSGTLLDLNHYRCNNVYRPWVNRGKRRTRTLQSYIVRSNGTYRKGSGEAGVRLPGIHQVVDPTMGGCSAPPSSDLKKHSGGRCVSPEPQFEFDVCPDPVRRRSTLGQSDAVFILSPNDGERRCASPERQFECDGWCRDPTRKRSTLRQSDVISVLSSDDDTTTTLQHADVISISSSDDGQTSWDARKRNGDSISMTSFLIKILEKYPQITLTELMTRLNQEIHSFTMRMHANVARERRERNALIAKLKGWIRILKMPVRMKDLMARRITSKTSSWEA